MPDVNTLPEITLDDVDRAPDSVIPSRTDVPVSISELNAAFSRVTEENSILKQDMDALKKRAKTTEILDTLIVPSAGNAFSYLSWYSAAVLFLLLMSGSENSEFKLPESVLNFLVGSTAVTVIGLVGMVLTGIFIGARSR